MEYLLSDLSKEATCFLLQTNKCPSSDINHPSFSLPPAPILSLEPRYSHSLGILSWNEFCCCWMSFRDPIWNGETVTILGKKLKGEILVSLNQQEALKALQPLTMGSVPL